MDHNQAMDTMAAERYLLNELTPEVREAFEEHLFDCQECAWDVRAGAAFVDEARVQLPELTSPLRAPSRSDAGRRAGKRDRWLAWWQPVFVAPAFAALLAVLGYQNLITLPALRASVEEPRVMAMSSLHGDSRGGGHAAIAADREHGISIPLDLPPAEGAASFGSYRLELYGPGHKLAWSATVASPEPKVGLGAGQALDIPGRMLGNGTFTLVVAGIGIDGERSATETYVFDVRMID